MFHFSDCGNLSPQEAIAHRVELSGGHLSEAVATRLAILTTHRIPAIDCLNRTTVIPRGMSLTVVGVPLVRIRRVVTITASRDYYGESSLRILQVDDQPCGSRRVAGDPPR